MKDYLLKKTLDFQNATAKSHLIGLVSEDLFNKFPDNLPENIKNNWKNKIGELVNSIGKEQAPANFDDYGFLVSLASIMKREDANSDFRNVILQQEIINYLAYFEAFMQDVFRHVYTDNPSLIPEDKELKWKEIVDKKDYSSILNYVINKQLEKSGYDKLSTQITRLNNKPFLFKIKVDKKTLKSLEKLICVRNIIIHNGSKVNAELLELINDSSIKLNDFYQLSRKECNEAYNLVLSIAIEVYASVYFKLYNKEIQTSYEELSYNSDYLNNP